MSARTKARKRALDVLYASEVRRESPVEALDRAIKDGEGPTNDYTATLVRGVVAEQSTIDDLLGTASEGWSLDRMPAVDRNILRIGAYELRINGLLGPVLLGALPHDAVSLEPRHTVVMTTGEDGADLLDVLQLLVDTGVEVEAVREISPAHDEPEPT